MYVYCATVRTLDMTKYMKDKEYTDRSAPAAQECWDVGKCQSPPLVSGHL